MDRSDDLSGNTAPDQSVDADDAALIPGLDRSGNGECCLSDELVSEQQDLRQYKEDQEHGDQGPSSETLSDACDGAVGSQESDDGSGDRKDRPGGDDRRECKIHCFDNRIFPPHGLPALLIPGTDYDSVIDVRTHLNGGDDQVAYKEQVRLHQGREGEVDEDRSFDDRDQQQRHARRLEGKEQDHQHEEDRDH